MNVFNPALRFAAALLLAANTAHAQTAPLNDTGQTQCYDAANAPVACDAATVGNAGTRPHQDGRYGRDPKAGATPALSKVGGGAAGFDFSCVLWNGTVINGPSCHTGLVANTAGTASATPATDWACTKDNVTGLVWSLETKAPTDWATATSATYADAGHNTPARCGFNSAWRVPKRRELLSIAHYQVSNPAIDAAYFPATVSNWYWTSETYSPDPARAWVVFFSDGYTDAVSKTSSVHVRLVRGGQ